MIDQIHPVEIMFIPMGAVWLIAAVIYGRNDRRTQMNSSNEHPTTTAGRQKNDSNR